MTLLPHLFKPPKRTNTKHCETVKYWVENGFRYQYVHKKFERRNVYIICYQGCFVYPDNLIEPNEFVENYKEQLPN